MQVGLKPNMNPSNSFFARMSRGFKAGLQGLQSLFKEGLIVYAILPAAIGLLAGVTLAYGTYSLLHYWLIEGLEASGALDTSWLSWLGSLAGVVLVSEPTTKGAIARPEFCTAVTRPYAVPTWWDLTT